MNLTKKQALVILLSTLLFVVSSSSIYLLTPYPQESSTSDNAITNENTLDSSKASNSTSITTSNNVMIENIKLINKNSSLSATINIPTADIYLASEQLFKKLDNEKISNPKIEILDNSVKVSFLYRLIGKFNTAIVCKLTPTVSNNTLTALVDTVSIGKIQLNDSLIKFGIKKLLKNNEYNVKFSDKTISFDLASVSPQLTLSDFNLNNSKLSITLTYNFTQSK